MDIKAIREKAEKKIKVWSVHSLLEFHAGNPTKEMRNLIDLCDNLEQLQEEVKLLGEELVAKKEEILAYHNRLAAKDAEIERLRGALEDGAHYMHLIYESRLEEDKLYIRADRAKEVERRMGEAITDTQEGE